MSVSRSEQVTYACLMVALYVTAPSQVVLTVADHVRIDQVTLAGPQRHGALISPGSTTIDLTEGMYLFRTTSDAQVKIADPGVVTVTALADPNNKDEWPDPSPHGLPDEVVASKGDATPDHTPKLTVVA
jgi:hypothetical protein